MDAEERFSEQRENRDARERFRLQQREKVTKMVGEDMAEEFIIVASDGGHSRPEDVALLMAITYIRGMDDLTRSNHPRYQPVQRVLSGNEVVADE